MDSYFIACAVAVALAGAITDVRSRRISNRLTLTSLPAALVARLIVAGPKSLASGAIGMLIAGGAFFLIFLLRGVGGGDVKLMATVGAWVGSESAVPLLIAVAVAGGFLALFYLNGTEIPGAVRVNPRKDEERSLAGTSVPRVKPTHAPFAVAIACGVSICAIAVLLRR